MIIFAARFLYFQMPNFPSITTLRVFYRQKLEKYFRKCLMTYNALKLYHVFISADHYFQEKDYVIANKKLWTPIKIFIILNVWHSSLIAF